MSFLSPDTQELDSYPDFNIFDENASTMKKRGDDFTSPDAFGDIAITDNLITTDRSPKNENAEEVQSTISSSTGGLQSLNNTFKPINVDSDSGFDGDKHTLLSFGTTDSDMNGRTQYKETTDESYLNDLNGVENGMPFYFKDMRDGSNLVFRAYIEGLSENIAPSYNSTQYIGRSEPVYTYSQTERDVNFTLKLFAQSKEELAAIYEKMNKLTSLCYPEYMKDVNSSNGGELTSYGNRMKPPLTKMRIGDIYGAEKSELMGYLKSLSYTVDQTSPYETEVGARVPHHINVALTYQVIHATVPSLDTKFYGFDGFAVGVGRNF